MKTVNRNDSFNVGAQVDLAILLPIFASMLFFGRALAEAGSPTRVPFNHSQEGFGDFLPRGYGCRPAGGVAFAHVAGGVGRAAPPFGPVDILIGD